MASIDNPWYTTQTVPGWSATIETDSGQNVIFTGVQDSDLLLVFKNQSNGQEVQGTGTAHLAQTSPVPIITYIPSPTDVAAPALYFVQVWVTFPAGPEPFDLGYWEIRQK